MPSHALSVEQFHKKYGDKIQYSNNTEPNKIFSLNGMGPVKTEEFDPYSNYYINKATKSLKVLEIGCGYGFMTAKILRHTRDTIITINDLDYRHMIAAIDKVGSKNHQRLRLCPGVFPDELNFPDSSFDVIGSICILHFLTPQQIIQAIAKIRRWLKQGGEFIFVNASIYNKRCKSKTEQYLKSLKNGQKWVGETFDYWQLAPSDRNTFPNYFNFAAREDYRRLANEQNFIIKDLEYFSWTQDSPSKAYLGGIFIKN